MALSILWEQVLPKKKWTDEYKKELIQSRVDASQSCVRYIQNCNLKPKFFLNASAVGIYGGDNPNETDETGPAATDFMGTLCNQWEAASQNAGIRTVQMRIGVVLGKGGGALQEMLPLYKKHIGGILATGKQGFSWIHIADLIKAMRFLMDSPTISGPVNLTTNWLTQADFSKALEKALDKRNPFFVPKFVLNLILGERSILVWGGQKAIPNILKEAGFSYQFATIDAALNDIC